ncbi:RNAse Z [Moraxella cuniculi DSM 21768]|uniref:Ribonuclease Z n=1 Tax=Moraxella cuniculi DSM 21768 TaxID=1122245 RepID=A0A1N7F3K4_9GAMM|nr:ribonuclease Z [Moraxella cuniculi]OOS05019.1 hypothetical protein B0189_07580 [Moraxella cuniculi]SIR94795.1 RNAse Z [Moraxella cuniculi DSM 21768]
MFELTFLGTSSGVPTKMRNVSALAVSMLGRRMQAGKSTPWILVDCGEGTQHRLLQTAHKPSMLQAICITHAHGDHCYGLMGLLASLAMHGRSEPLLVIAPKAVGDLLQACVSLTQMNLSYRIDFIDIAEIIDTGVQYQLADDWTIDIQICPMSHRIECFGFVITQELAERRLDTTKLLQAGIDKRHWQQILAGRYEPCLPQSMSHSDFVISRQYRQKIVIAGDNDKPELLQQAVMGADLLVHEATYTQAVLDKVLAQNKFNPQHSSALQVAQFAKCANIPNLILTHFSARFLGFDDPSDTQPNMGHIRQEVQNVYGGKLILAADMMRVHLSADGQMNQRDEAG